LGTSGTGRQGFFHQGKRYGHIIDPRTGWPTNHVLSSTVISPSAALSDALATAFFVMELSEVETYCNAHPEISALLVVPSKAKGKIDLEWFNLSDDQWRRLV
jgi:thiamine biosynthesis lipoprotein